MSGVRIVFVVAAEPQAARHASPDRHTTARRDAHFSACLSTTASVARHRLGSQGWRGLQCWRPRIDSRDIGPVRDFFLGELRSRKDAGRRSQHRQHDEQEAEQIHAVASMRTLASQGKWNFSSAGSGLAAGRLWLLIRVEPVVRTQCSSPQTEDVGRSQCGADRPVAERRPSQADRVTLT
jgi:hypothetical protein